MRASGAPRRSGFRVETDVLYVIACDVEVVGFGELAGSRLAAPMMSASCCPAFTALPPKVMSSVTIRVVACTGLSYRSSSSVACSMRSGSRRNRSN